MGASDQTWEGSLIAQPADGLCPVSLGSQARPWLVEDMGKWNAVRVDGEWNGGTKAALQALLKLKVGAPLGASLFSARFSCIARSFRSFS